jgi:hypothetical protein
LVREPTDFGANFTLDADLEQLPVANITAELSYVDSFCLEDRKGARPQIFVDF